MKTDDGTFLLKEEHIKLITAMYVDWCDDYDGAPAIDAKRPYGNSHIISDIYEVITGKSWNWDEEMSEDIKEELMKLHEETRTALQIVLCTQSFVPGLYKKYSKYNELTWELVD